MGKEFWISFVVVFVVYAILAFVVHGLILSSWYMQQTDIWFTAEEARGMYWHFIAELVFAFLFTMIYSKGYEANKGGAGQGFRYGLLMGLIIYLPMQLTYLAVMKVPGKFLAIQGILELAIVVICGAVLGALYKPEPKPGM